MTVAIPESLSLVKNWKTLSRVKLFCAHRLRLPNGEVIDVGPERLRKIASSVNTTGIRTGRWPTMSEDHIVTFENGKQKVRPSSQIRILGYQANLGVEVIDGEEWLTADALAFPSEYETIQKLPFRSVEFHPHRDIITNVAYTKHTPQLEVGTLLPEHWQRGYASSESHKGQKATDDRLVAYALGSSDGIIVYSIQGMPAMNNDVLLQGLSTLRKGISDLIEKMAETPAVIPPEKKELVTTVTETVSYESHPEFIKLKEERDALVKEKETLNASKQQLETEKRTNDRKAKLAELAKTRKLDPETEMKSWGDAPDEVFAKHCDTIVASYASRSSGGAVVEPLDGAQKIQDAELMTRAQKITSRRIRAGDDSMQLHHVMDAVRKNPDWDGTGNPL